MDEKTQNGSEIINKIINRVGMTINGKDKQLEKMAACFIAGGNLLLEDVPGVGKTTAVKAFAAAVGCGFSRIQFTPDTMPSDVTGMSIYNPAKKEFEVVPGAVMNNIILVDEINRTPARTQASLLEAMEEKQVTVDGKTFMLPEPFMVVATCNPIEQVGTYELPEAQKDRFMMRISMGYPDSESEKQMLLGAVKRANTPQSFKESVIDRDMAIRLRREAGAIRVHEDIADYIVRICSATRNSELIRLGASPRAAVSLIRLSQAIAYIRGRGYVIPEDIKYICSDVLAHRIILSAKAEGSGRTAIETVEEVLRGVAIPAVR